MCARHTKKPCSPGFFLSKKNTFLDITFFEIQKINEKTLQVSEINIYEKYKVFWGLKIDFGHFYDVFENVKISCHK